MINGLRIKLGMGRGEWGVRSISQRRDRKGGKQGEKKVNGVKKTKLSREEAVMVGQHTCIMGLRTELCLKVQWTLMLTLHNGREHILYMRKVPDLIGWS